MFKYVFLYMYIFEFLFFADSLFMKRAVAMENNRKSFEQDNDSEVVEIDDDKTKSDITETSFSLPI